MPPQSGSKKDKLKSLGAELLESTEDTDFLVQRVSPLSKHLFQMDDGYIDFLKADTNERERILASGARAVTSEMSNDEILGRRHVGFLEKLDRHPGIKENWTYQPTTPENLEHFVTILAQKAYVARFKDDAKGWDSLKKKKSNEWQVSSNLPNFNHQYVSPSSRILLMSNLSFNEFNVIEVYSDIPNETLNSLKSLQSLVFEYTDENFFNRAANPSLARAIDYCDDERNTIRCNCKAKGIANCYENENCPCYKINLRMRQFQNIEPGCVPAEFRTNKPVKLASAKDIFFNNVGFACSDLCACKGECTNNVTRMIDRHFIPLEVFRNNALMGFNVYSPVFIPAGTPVMELTGEIVTRGQVDTLRINYAYQSAYQCDTNISQMLLKVPFTSEYRKLISELSTDEYYIDPTFFGNVARLVSHSCLPNLEVVRVYQKSLSPAHVRLVMISMLDIYPGTPFSIDYGHNFAQRIKKHGCQCKIFCCQNNQDEPKLADMDYNDLVAHIVKMQMIQKKQFLDNVAQTVEPIGQNCPSTSTQQ